MSRGSSLLFVARLNGEFFAANTRNVLKATLKDVTRKSMAGLKTSLSAVADCTSTMTCIFNASVLQNLVPHNCCWVGCISHQLNAAMKHAMSSKVISNGLVEWDFNAVKTVATLFERALLYFNLLTVFALDQEIRTCFKMCLTSQQGPTSVSRT